MAEEELLGILATRREQVQERICAQARSEG